MLYDGCVVITKILYQAYCPSCAAHESGMRFDSAWTPLAGTRITRAR